MTGAAAALAVLAGLAGSVQVAVMGRFGGRIGLAGAFRAPPWMWAGGPMGLLVVFSITFAQPRLGAKTTIGILIGGQLVMGAAIDRFGWFGVDQIGLSWTRLAGIVLLGAGAALSLAK